MKKIAHNLYQFSMYLAPMDFTIHQYLLTSTPSVLFAAGTAQQAHAIIPEIRTVLNGRDLDYVFVSHMESDEAGGVFYLHDAFPNVKVICGNLAARELPGWGYDGTIVAVHSNTTFEDGELSLQIVDYPSEVHDQLGIVALERTTGIFYSSDLFLRYGNGIGQTVHTSWIDEVESIGADRVKDPLARAKLQDDLRALCPQTVAVGHGYCLSCV